jgi:hypothetical protein
MNATIETPSHPAAPNAYVPSEKQYRFARRLMNDRDISKLNDEWRVRIERLRLEIDTFFGQIERGIFDMTSAPKYAHPLDYKRMGALLDTLKTLPMVADRNGGTSSAWKIMASEFPNIEDGRYAVETDDDDHHLAFYKVNKPDDTSRWHGRLFVNVMASDNEIKLTGKAARTVLEKIAADPLAAMIRFGHEIKVCGRCGRTLTKKSSREAGIGPKCASDMGM